MDYHAGDYLNHKCSNDIGKLDIEEENVITSNVTVSRVLILVFI